MGQTSADALGAFQAQADRLAAAVRARPRGTRWLLHCDTDADGLAGAAVVATTLLRCGHRFQVRASRDKTDAAYRTALAQDAGGHFFLDKGTSHLDVLARAADQSDTPVLVIDHHSLVQDDVPEGVLLLNPRAVGLDGSRDASGSTACVAFAVALLGEAGWDLGPIGLTGAIGDWQHVDGWHGWNRVLVEEGLRRGVLAEGLQPAYIGMDLAEAVAHKQAPHLPGLTGDAAAARAFLAALRVPATAGDAGSLGRDERTRFVSGLVLHGLAEGVGPDAFSGLVHTALSSPRLGMELRHAFRTVDACGREGRESTGVAFLMGDAAARRDAEAHYQRYRRTLGDALARLREEGPAAHQAFQRFAIESPAYTGMVAGLAMTLFLKDRDRPFVVTALRPDGDVQVSTRATERQVAVGLDLADACRVAGAAVGREGGGHPVAAGVVVAEKDLERFLAALDEALLAQGFLASLHG